MNKLFIFLIIAILVTATGCSAAAPAAPGFRSDRGAAPLAGAPAPAQQPAAPALEYGKSADSGGQATNGNQPQSANAAGAERMIVYSGDLSLIVKDATVAVDQITQIVKDAGGFVVSSNTYQDQGHTRASMTVRIPGEDLTQLKATLSKIETLALQVESRKLDGQDVTDQYADTQAQIDNLTAQRDSYRNLLDRATKMEDILNIQTRLDQVQGQINTLTGQQLRLKESVKFSTININITPDALAQPITIGNWRPEGTARDAFRALLNALQFIGNALIWTGICILPVALLVGVPAFLVLRFALSRRKKAMPSKPPA